MAGGIKIYNNLARSSEDPLGSLPGSETKSGAGRELVGGITPFGPFREARQAEGKWSVRSQRLTLKPLQYPPGGTSGVKEHSTSPTIKTQMVLPVRELSRQPPIARLVAAIEPIQRTGNVGELREDPAFEWILEALNGMSQVAKERRPGNWLYGITW